MFNKLFGKDKDKQSKVGTSSSSSSGGGRARGSTDAGQLSSSMEKIDTSLDLLEKREEILEKKVEAELTKAKAFMAKKNKAGALQCMKRKKLLEDQLTNIAAQKANMETMKFAIQNTRMNSEVVNAQKTAQGELARMNKKMNAEKIEDDMDALRDTMDEAKRVSEALNQPLDDNYVDEDDLMAELEDAMLDGELEGLGDVSAPATKLPNMPSVPAGKLPAKKQSVAEDDEEALRMLEAELGG